MSVDYIKAILEGDSILLRELYRNFFPMIRKMVKENSGNDADAKDVFQSALQAIFLKASQPAFQLTSSFSTLLYGFAQNIWRNQLKRKGRGDVTIPQDDTYIDDANGHIDFVALERQKLFDRHYARLGEECRKILSWFFEKKPMKEIAELLAIKEANARKKKSRCQVKLTEAIENDPAYQELRN